MPKFRAALFIVAVGVQSAPVGAQTQQQPQQPLPPTYDAKQQQAQQPPSQTGALTVAALPPDKTLPVLLSQTGAFTPSSQESGDHYPANKETRNSERREGFDQIAARDGRYWQSGIFPAKVVDPSGSGDAFDAGVITAIRRGFDLPRMLAYASALGSSATRAVGTTDGVFTAAEAEAFLAANTLKITAGKL